SKDVGGAIDDWPAMVTQLSHLPHVIAAAPVLYDQVFLTGPQNGKGAILKGIQTGRELAASDVLRHLSAGSLAHLDDTGGLPGLIVGAKLAFDTGLTVGTVATVIDPQGVLTPFGRQPRSQRFRVVGVF